MLIAAAAGSLILIWRMLAKFVNKTQSHAFYHGTSVSSGLALLNGDPLNVEIAEQLKIDGPPGFYLATSSTDAEYFAARRSPGTILKYMIAGSALQTLTMQGAIVEPVPAGGIAGGFEGAQLKIPPFLFGMFDNFRASDHIVVIPFKPSE